MKRFFDYDPLTGIETTFAGGDGAEFSLISTQDVQPFIEHNKRLQNTGKDYWRAGGDWRHEATIPIGVQFEWKQKYGIEVWNPEHGKAVVKKLNDPDWRYLKTAEIII